MEALDGMPQDGMPGDGMPEDASAYDHGAGAAAAAHQATAATPTRVVTYSDPRGEAWFLGCALVRALPTVNSFRNGALLLWDAEAGRGDRRHVQVEVPVALGEGEGSRVGDPTSQAMAQDGMAGTEEVAAC